MFSCSALRLTAPRESVHGLVSTDALFESLRNSYFILFPGWPMGFKILHILVSIHALFEKSANAYFHSRQALISIHVLLKGGSKRLHPDGFDRLHPLVAITLFSFLTGQKFRSHSFHSFYERSFSKAVIILISFPGFTEGFWDSAP